MAGTKNAEGQSPHGRSSSGAEPENPTKSVSGQFSEADRTLLKAIKAQLVGLQYESTDRFNQLEEKFTTLSHKLSELEQLLTDDRLRDLLKQVTQPLEKIQEQLSEKVNRVGDLGPSAEVDLILPEVHLTNLEPLAKVLEVDLEDLRNLARVLEDF